MQSADKLSRNRQKQLTAKGHPVDLLEQAQQAVTTALENLNSQR